MAEYPITLVSAFNATPDWITQKSYEACALRLAYSLRKNGGSLSDIPLIFFVQPDYYPQDDTVDRLLNEFNCQVYDTMKYRRLPMQSSSGSWSPKIYAVEAAQHYIKTPMACWIDCDYYVMDDFSELVDIGRRVGVAAPPMNLISNFGAGPDYLDMWEKYYDHFDIPLDLLYLSKYKVETYDGGVGFFYFTSSVMTWKTGIGFEKTYFDISYKLINSGLPYCDKRYTQTSVPLTILKNGYSWDVIPKHLAYMYHLQGYDLNNDPEPVLVHYGDNLVTEIPDKDWNV